VSESQEPGAEETQPRRRKRPFYGWYIVFTSFLAHLSYAEQNSSVLGVFFRPMNAELGWSRTSMAGAQSVARLVEGLLSPVVGPIVDRHGAKRLMISGALIAGFGFLALSQVQSLWQWYLLKGGVIAVGFLMMGNLVTNIAISNWFVRQRGRAIGIAGMGTSLTSVGMAPAIVWLTDAIGWRAPWIVFAVFTWVAVIPATALLMRRRPEDHGLLPDGDRPDAAPARSGPGAMEAPPAASGDEEPPQPQRVAPLEPVWTRRQVLGTFAFWLLILTFSIAQLAFQGINISVVPFFEDLGFSSSVGAIALSTRAFFGLVAASFWGLAAEKIDVRYLGTIKFIGQGLASLLFLRGRTLPVLYTGLIIYGISSAGSAVISELMWATFYGRLTLGRVRSMGAPCLVLFSAVGPVFMNQIFDRTGSYDLAYVIFIGLFASSSVLILLCRKPTPKRYGRATDPEFLR
jgi:MFS family permease